MACRRTRGGQGKTLKPTGSVFNQGPTPHRDVSGPPLTPATRKHVCASHTARSRKRGEHASMPTRSPRQALGHTTRRHAGNNAHRARDARYHGRHEPQKPKSGGDAKRPPHEHPLAKQGWRTTQAGAEPSQQGGNETTHKPGQTSPAMQKLKKPKGQRKQSELQQDGQRQQEGDSRPAIQPPAHRARHWALRRGGKAQKKALCARDCPRRGQHSLQGPHRGESKEHNTESRTDGRMDLDSKQKNELLTATKSHTSALALYEITTTRKRHVGVTTRLDTEPCAPSNRRGETPFQRKKDVAS